MLGTMDPTMSQAEIDSIIEEEKQRKKQRVLKTCNKLKNYEEGTLLPTFPDIFGSNGLIQDVPQVVKEVSENTSKAVIDPIMEIFYGDVAPVFGTGSYVNWWNQSLGQTSYLFNKPSSVFSRFSLEAKNDEYLFGYTPATTQATTTPIKTLAGSTPGYNFGRNFNVDNKGLDKDDADEVFKEMKEAFGITNSWENWYYNNIAAHIEEYDTGGGKILPGQFFDPFDQNTEYEVEVDRSDSKNRMATIRRYSLSPTQQLNARPAGYSDDIVTLSLRHRLRLSAS